MGLGMVELETMAGAEIPVINVTPLLGWSLIGCKCDVLKLFKPAECCFDGTLRKIPMCVSEL